ncbi:MAG: hypothetical protein C4563_08670 [Desulfobulbus sp.]|nr:MAG: hypothetical protein C4563_08670 [Desulfobulbus sp.]
MARQANPYDLILFPLIIPSLHEIFLNPLPVVLLCPMFRVIAKQKSFIPDNFPPLHRRINRFPQKLPQEIWFEFPPVI